MTRQSDFTPEEWDLLREAPTTAGMMVATAQRGGTFRETFAMAKAWAEARQEHGESELLDELVASKPGRGKRYGSAEELKQDTLQHLRDTVELLGRKATPEETDDYKRFILNLVERVAKAHREDGENVSDAEQAAIGEVSTALGATGA